MNVPRVAGLALAAAVVLSACGGGGEGAQERSVLDEERSLLEYIPEVLRPTCVTRYKFTPSDDCLFSCPDAMDVVALYSGAVAGFACRYGNAEVRYLRYRTVSSLHAALEDRWGNDAEGCPVGGVQPSPEYHYRVGGGPVGGFFRFAGYVFIDGHRESGRAWDGTWTDDRARVLADVNVELGETRSIQWWEALISRSVNAGASWPQVDLQRVPRGRRCAR